MGASYLSDALLFLVNTLFSLYILLVVLRFMLQTVRADSRNPVSQFLLAATNPRCACCAESSGIRRGRLVLHCPDARAPGR